MDHCEFANRYIIIDANIKAFCTAPRKENFFNMNLSNKPFFSPEKTAAHDFGKKILQAVIKNQVELQYNNPHTLTFLNIDTFKNNIKNTNFISQEEDNYQEPLNIKEIKIINQQEDISGKSFNQEKKKRTRLNYLEFNTEKQNSFLTNINKNKNKKNNPLSTNLEYQSVQKKRHITTTDTIEK